MERLEGDSAEWWLVREGACLELESHEAATKSGHEAINLGQLEPLSDGDWVSLASDVEELGILSRFANAQRARLILRMARLHPADRDRALDLVQATEQRIEADLAEARDSLRGCDVLRADLPRFLAKSREPGEEITRHIQDLLRRLSRAHLAGVDRTQPEDKETS